MEKLRYIVYCRRSSEDNREKQALSISAQVDEAKRVFGKLEVADWVEESHSAFDIGRPKFNKMIEDLRVGKAEGIICWHPDRLSRNPVDAGIIIHMLDKGLIKDLKFVSYPFNNDAEGKMFLGMLLSQSKYYSDKLSKDVKRGQAKKLRTGQWPGTAPTGYINSYSKAKGEQEVYPDPERFHLVRKMWDLILTGQYSVEQVIKVANEEWGFRMLKRRHSGGGPIGRTTAYDMFTNSFYCGIMKFNGESYPGVYEKMITQDEFDEVQRILGDRGKPRAQTHNFAYTGLIKCGECGGSITAQINSKKLKNGDTKYYTYYHCTKRKAGFNCLQKSVEENAIEEVIKNELKDFSIPKTFRDWAIEYLNELNDSEVGDRQQNYVNVEKNYNNCQAFLDRLTKGYYKELIDEAEFIKQKEELLAKKREYKSQLDKIDNRADRWLESSLKVFEFAKSAQVRFEKGYWRVKKDIAFQLGSNFLLIDGKLTLQRGESLTMLAHGIKEIKSKYPRFKLNEIDKLTGSGYEKTEDFSSVRSVWRGGRDSNPQPSA